MRGYGVVVMIQRIGPAVQLELRASWLVRGMILALALLAALSLYFSTVPNVLLLIVPAIAWHSYRSTSKGLPVRLTLSGDGRALWVADDGQSHPVEPLTLYERGPFGVLVVLMGGRRCRLVWGTDSLPREARRKLRLWMRDHVSSAGIPAPASSSPGTTTRPG